MFYPIRKFKIRSDEYGLLFRDREFVRVLDPGRHWVFDPLLKVRVNVVSQRDPWLQHEKLDVIEKSGQLAGRAEVVDLKDDQRALVWIDGRFSHVLPPGLYAYWTGFKQVRVEVIDAQTVRFEHAQLPVILKSPLAARLLDAVTVDRDHVGVLFVDGAYEQTLRPGRYAFWKDVADARVVQLDMREQTLDVSGQEIMTADKVSLRLNALVMFRVIDARKAVSVADSPQQSLYREAQLVLRSTIGGLPLDDFLAAKEAVADQIDQQLTSRSAELGLEVTSVGIRDVILPGDMRELMNKVTEAKKAAEANLISRREETAAMRSQANTAKLLESNPTLMRLRELETLERVAPLADLKVVLGDKGLTDKIVNLL